MLLEPLLSMRSSPDIHVCSFKHHTCTQDIMVWPRPSSVCTCARSSAHVELASGQHKHGHRLKRHPHS